MKRVAFIINRMNFRPSSGHGIFMKGVADTLLQHGHFIDVICDGEPEDNFLESYNINVYTPDKSERLSYGKHTTLFQFADSFNFEKSINFRTALVKALTNHKYDLIICNDTESAFVCYQMELYKHIKIASYAHECATANPELGEGVFKDCYYNLIEKMMFWPEITTLVQTEQNRNKLLETLKVPSFETFNAQVQLYPLTDSNSLGITDKDGLLFIGRHEDRKNPSEYIKVLKSIKDKYGVEIKANVMTRTAHVKKFEADFASIGHTNYEIVSDVVGLEKAEIIQKSKVAFMPYKNESFGIAVLEALRYMPTVVLNKYNWHYNFTSFRNYYSIELKDAADTIWKLYNDTDVINVEPEFHAYHKEYESSLLNLLSYTPVTTTKTEPRNRLYQYLKDNKGTWVSLSDYFASENSKGTIYLTSDIETIYNSSSWYQVLHTNSSTFLGIPEPGKEIQHSVKASKSSELLSEFFE